ncbi:MarR family winged helix-turn-helix transcriptional regulator [Luteithermobacter gelatinilyticus]|uniref:MarR family winged helix-turn-helix transcriptional regulator n=1 Tax=Luteithermobacter gelatinilyticus TaxID=2582913 RepID=UPI00143D7E18|nr:MarR family transcriptional regulator [Luteithermobacter gelatinilyticus]|tara:strand:+ start:19250 stop:19753 length:504 start_codon:yes stop_codon:yes gene_type:complete
MTDVFFQQDPPITQMDDDQVFLKGMELLYFAYRDFISWPDDVLHHYGLGRAHHRVLHFVHRNPGLRVTDLLRLLNITKQSLSRVLSTLIDKGYIRQNIGEQDRRQRLLYLTDKGEDLLTKIARHQKEHLLKACAAAGPEAVEGFWKVLTALLNEENREEVLAHVNKP